MTTSTKPKTLTTTIIGPNGTYWLYGWREEAWGTARFKLLGGADHEPEVDNADWPTMWGRLHDIMKHPHVESTMRCVLP